MNAKQRQDYLESEGTHCPFCKSADIEGGLVESANYFNGYELEVTCNNCNKSWTEIYTLTDVEDNEEE